ncbi:hypothetical protein H1191_12745 [Paenactinomyces guangxiensis]|uniref:Condensation domain-containing protein n=1 Tax=Paenactinomyces guangxiensis TaxID=1490290 RepID=A0A7W1WSC2_9BACL|nr:hypothetical protein [Paenactinomyces guangxiensis]MBH8592142.1 hypothetical protein [Paenactinomyces guangxiensis]
MDELKHWSIQEQVTLFVTLFTAFIVLLYRYSGQEDIIVGTPVSNRNRSEIEGLIGFFVNTLALRTNLSGNPSFQQLVKKVKEMFAEAYMHQDIPFEKLVAELKPERDVSQSPLFRVMFALQNAPLPPLELPGLVFEPVEVYNDTAKFDLFLSITELEDGLSCVLEYSYRIIRFRYGGTNDGAL